MTISVEQPVFFFLQKTCRTETFLLNTSQWLLLIHLLQSNVQEWYENFVFQKVDQVPLHFFPYQNVRPLVTFDLNFQLWSVLQRDQNYTYQFVFERQRAADEFITQFWYNAWTHFLFNRLRDVLKLSQKVFLQKVSSQCPKPW